MHHILATFLVFFIVYENYLGYRIKKLLKINPLTPIKILDCKPCLSFWITTPLAYFDITTPLFIYSLIFIFESLKK
jgi:hypothetical protein